MATLTEKEIEDLKISDFIFHVVHHGQKDPVLFDEVPLEGFESFFIDRIKETLKGNRFSFQTVSQTKQKLNDVESGNLTFLDISKRLAVQFHRFGDKRVKTGVLIVIRLRTGKRNLYSLIKYDSEKVIIFKTQGAKAILEAVKNNFTESPKALQKSALIDLASESAQVVVIDKQSRSAISGFFKEFLGVERLKTNAALTGDLVEAVKRTIKQHANQLPASLVSKMTNQIIAVVNGKKEFEEEKFFEVFFGPHGSDEVRETFFKELDKYDLNGEVFEFDKDAVALDTGKKYSTSEGITINIPERAKGTIEMVDDDNGTTITIRTSRVREI